MDWLQLIHGPKAAARFSCTPGDDVRVWFKIAEQGKERLGQFEGIVIRVRGSGPSKTFTVRRLTHGVGVERVFPFDAPVIDRVELLRSGKAKRSRLYFLRHVVKKTRLEEAEGPEAAASEKAAAAEPEAALAKGEPTKS
jgi:large subunit ribosomal protein L19